MRWLKILTILLVLASIGGGLLVTSLRQPYAAFQGEVFIEIPKGISSRAIGQMLANAGVVQNPWVFLSARLFHPRAKLQAGEYRFAGPTAPEAVYERISRGDVFYMELAIPEGLNMFDIASVVERLGLMGSNDFLAAAKDPSLIQDLDSEAPTLEGYLFPDTYRVHRHPGARELCSILTNRFRAEWKRLGGSPKVHDTVTLASLIEKEAAAAEDRPLISSVFHNRLKMGMKLDCDPTTVYAALLDGRYRGVIHRSDLASVNPYNTYQHAGLPPGPIANPGIASLQAALAPAETEYLYFVARPDGSGRHQFSKDIAAHQAAAARYRHGAAK